MEPLSTTIKLLNSKYKIHRSRELSIPLTRCDAQVFNGMIKQENTDNQIFNQINKKEIIDETDHHKDRELLQTRTEVEENIDVIDTNIKFEMNLLTVINLKEQFQTKSTMQTWHILTA